MNASSKGFLDIVRYLVEDAGASIDAQSKHGYSALSESRFSVPARQILMLPVLQVNAASKGNLPIVIFLAKRGGSPLLRNNFCETAFDLAAAVFEVHVCSVLAVLESSLRTPYNPLILHSTIPVVLHENQRLARPSLKKISSLSALAQSPRWSSVALSRNDGRTAFSFHSLLGTAKEGSGERPVFRSEVGLPIVGKEGELVLPETREVHSAGRTGSGRAPPTVAEGNRPAAGNRRTSASSALAAVLELSSASSPLTSPPISSTSTFPVASGEPAWFWLSDWVRRVPPRRETSANAALTQIVDLTHQASSPVDGYSYATSFDAPPEEWTSEPPPELRLLLEGGGGGLGLGRQKWVRRRRWVRVMRRRLDLPPWGYGEEARSREREEVPSSDYLVKALFHAGANPCNATLHSSGAGVCSGKTVTRSEDDAEVDRAELRRTAARLERAADELRAGMAADEDVERTRKAQDQLEDFLRQLALIRSEFGPEEADEGALLAVPSCTT